MSDEERNAGSGANGTAALPLEQPIPDEHTTEPNAPEQAVQAAAPARGKWEMPKPKFQQTSGYLPQGYLKDMEAAAAATEFHGSEDTTQEQAAYVASPPAAEAIATPSSAAALPDVEPQPDLDEGLIADEPGEVAAAPSEAKNRSSLPLAVLGVSAIVIFVAVFLVVVYFLFLAKP